MYRPAPATMYLKCDYWPMVDNARKEDETVTDWMFNFISISKLSFSDGWGLCSSLDLVDQVTGARPSFEDIKHPTFEEALNAAVEVGLKHGKHIVICSDPETGRDLQPSRITDSQNKNGVFIA